MHWYRLLNAALLFCVLTATGCGLFGPSSVGNLFSLERRPLPPRRSTGPPEVTGIYPTALYTSIENLGYNITAYYDGAPATAWSWDFGAVGSPNTSLLEQGFVSPGQPGEYNCSVTITNAEGSDSHSFVLTVQQPPLPYISFVSHKDEQGSYEDPLVAGRRYDFYAAESQDPFVSPRETQRWRWDFGGGCMPNQFSTTAPDHWPQVVAGPVPGEYRCVVLVTNAAATHEHTFLYNVVAGN